MWLPDSVGLSVSGGFGYADRREWRTTHHLAVASRLIKE